MSGGIILGIIGTLLYIYFLLSKMDTRLTVTVKPKTEGGE